MNNRIRAVLALLVALVAAWAGQHLLALASGSGLLMAASVGTTASVAGNVNEAMKIIFQEPLTNSIVADSEMLDVFEQDMNVQINQTTGGRYIEMAHYFALPSGVGARRLEGDYIPVPGGPLIKNSQVYLKKIEGTVQMTGDTMRRVKQGEGAFVTWARRHLPDLKTRVDNEIDRMLFGYGAGILARVNAATPATTLVLDSLYGVAGSTDAWVAFMEQMTVIASANADGSSPRSGVMTVSDINPATPSVTVDALATSLANDDYLFAGDSAANSSQGGGDDREIMGLLGMVDDGSILASFQGLTRSGYRPWRALIVDSTDTTLFGTAGVSTVSEDLLDYMDTVLQTQQTAKMDVLVMNPFGARAFWQNLRNDRRINDPRGSYTGGRGSALTMIFGDRDVQLKTPRKCPRNNVFGLTKSTFKRWQNTGWEWDDLTGSIWNRVTDATGRMDSFYAVGHMVMQTGCIAPHKNVKATGIAD